MDSLRVERKRRNWSTAYVAVQLGISTSTIDRWEASQSVPSAVHLVALANLYGVSADTILDSLYRQRNNDISTVVDHESTGRVGGETGRNEG